VNELVLTNLLLPVIDLMMSTPPSSAISKVAELELLTIMARHDDHKQGIHLCRVTKSSRSSSVVSS